MNGLISRTSQLILPTTHLFPVNCALDDPTGLAPDRGNPDIPFPPLILLQLLEMGEGPFLGSLFWVKGAVRRKAGSSNFLLILFGGLCDSD